LWLHASSWQQWLDLFANAGYAPSAPGWPSDPDTVDEARQHPELLAGHGIDEVTDHYAKIVAGLDSPPILIGHSFGGTIVEKLLGQGLRAAGIAIDAAPIKGVLPVPISSLRSAFPVLKNPANKNKAVSLSAGQFRYRFGNAIEVAESVRQTQPESESRPIDEHHHGHSIPRC
jgi:pimeloyl-ACP methyl ester carboxylesterase